MADKRKKSFYVPHSMLAEIEEEALRQDRTASWLIQRAWELALPSLRRIPPAPVALADERGNA